MRGGWYNDADCDDKTGFTKQEKQGFVCEYKTPLPTPAPNGKFKGYKYILLDFRFNEV